MKNKAWIQRLEMMGYRFVGPSKHSALKICKWTKDSIRGRNFCYKEKFYGIRSHRCLQMSPAVFVCNHKCLFCWRATPFVKKWSGKADEPDIIIDESVEAQKRLFDGFWGSASDKKKLREAMKPNQMAISLVGEPCFYPKLPGLIDEALSRKMSAFLVTNGTIPEMIEKLKNHQPTNLYITLPAPDREIYKKSCLPAGNLWPKIMKSLSMLRDFECNTVIRLTLAKKLNFKNPEKYAEIIEKAEPDFVEVKAFMSVGGSRRLIPYEDMPLHSEILEFAQSIEKHSSYKIRDEKKDSRVVLLMR
jgi:tRNA wybutosine-synthesizing protein 1